MVGSNLKSIKKYALMKCLILCVLVVCLVGCKIATISTLDYHHFRTYKNIEISTQHLGCKCHTQGIGWFSKTNNAVVTCQGKNTSYLHLFQFNGYRFEFAHAVQNDAGGRGYSHPSAIQSYLNYFPVAISEGRKDSSFIYFYKIKHNKIEESDIPVISYSKHLGATGIFEWKNNLYLMGFGWNSKSYALWKSASLNEIDFALIAEGGFKDITKDQYGAYNSVWIGTHIQSEILLYASYGSFYSKTKNYLDIYSVNIEKDNIMLKLKESIPVKGVTENTIKSLFFEGVTLKNYTNDTITILSAPQDFKKSDEKVFLKSIYEGFLIKKQGSLIK